MNRTLNYTMDNQSLPTMKRDKREIGGNDELHSIPMIERDRREIGVIVNGDIDPLPINRILNDKMDNLSLPSDLRHTIIIVHRIKMNVRRSITITAITNNVCSFTSKRHDERRTMKRLK